MTINFHPSDPFLHRILALPAGRISVHYATETDMRRLLEHPKHNRLYFPWIDDPFIQIPGVTWLVPNRASIEKMRLESVATLDKRLQPAVHWLWTGSHTPFGFFRQGRHTGWQRPSPIIGVRNEDTKKWTTRTIRTGVFKAQHDPDCMLGDWCCNPEHWRPSVDGKK